MKCPQSEVWVTALIPSNDSSSLWLQEKKKKNGEDILETFHVIERENGWHVRIKATGCLPPWCPEASIKTDSGPCQIKRAGFSLVSALCASICRVLTPFCCISELEFSQSKVQFIQSLASHYRISERLAKGLTSKMYYWHFCNNWIRLFNILPWA